MVDNSLLGNLQVLAVLILVLTGLPDGITLLCTLDSWNQPLERP